MRNPKYSFLLPAYKIVFFEEALESIKNQSYKDFKVIVSDDCSPEDLRSVYDKVIGNDPRFEFRRNTENIGGKNLVAHWNKLVDMCDTEYLIMASDDDVYKPEFLSQMDKLINKYPECDLFRGRSQKITGESKPYFEDPISSEYLTSQELILQIYQTEFVTCVANYVYKTQTLRNHGGFIDFPKAWFSDDATNIFMSKNGCCITSDVVFGFRKSQYNISSQWGNQDDCVKKTIASIEFNKWMKYYVTNIPDSKEKFKIISEYKQKVYGNIMNHIFHCPLFVFMRLLLECPNDVQLNKFRMFLHYLNNIFVKIITNSK